MAAPGHGDGYGRRFRHDLCAHFTGNQFGERERKTGTGHVSGSDGKRIHGIPAAGSLQGRYRSGYGGRNFSPRR